MEGDAAGFHDDWELLHANSPVESPDHSSFVGIDDYFSIDGSKLYAKPSSEDPATDSDNPSWVDPQFAAGRRSPAELWSDSGSDLSDERKFSDFGSADTKKDPGVGGFGGFGAGKVGDVGFAAFDGANLSDFEVEGDALSGDLGEIRASDRDSRSDQFWSDSDRMDAQKFDAADESMAEQKEPRDEADSTAALDKVKEVGRERRRIAWWKVPFEVLRYCVLRVGPVWSFSVAAAVVGLVILGRRLHRMKQKSRTLQLKVTLDDKKVSQFMSRAARLNEAFSVVRRVPIVRPALPGPAAGVTPSWPMMSLR